MFDVSTGEILMDGQDIRKLSLRELRRLIGYVPQEPFLFSTSLKRKLALGRESYSGRGARPRRRGSPGWTVIWKFFRRS